MGIIWILTFAWTVDELDQKAVIPLIGTVAVIDIIARLAFVLFDQSPLSYKWFAVVISYIEVSLSPVNYSIANLACAADAEERAFVISSMLAIGTAFNSWVPLSAFPTKQAPRYFRGYVLEVVLQVAYFSWTIVVMLFVNKQNKAKEVADGETDGDEK